MRGTIVIRLLALGVLVTLATLGLSSKPEPAHAAGGMTFTDISAGYGHNCAVNTDGAVWCWGNNSRGVLGSTVSGWYSTPVPIPELASGVLDVSAGAYHTCALVQDGKVKCWGDNEYGQLGATSEQDCGTPQYPRPCSRVPLDVTELTEVTALAAGGEHTCALLTDGHARCWGSNEYGQLGDGTIVDSMTPVDVLGTNGDPLTGLTAITAGYEHTCALTAAGGVLCWGENEYGQLGNGTFEESWAPVSVAGLTGSVIGLSDGSVSTHSCAIMALTHSIRCWGSNVIGELGDGTSFVEGTSEASKPTPVDVIGLQESV